MIKTALKLKRMFADSPEAYADKLGVLLKEREIDTRNVSIQDVAREFLGSNYDEVLPMVSEVSRLQRVERAGGTQVLPSAFAHISGFDATMAGLVGQLALDGYALPTAIGDEWCTTIPTRVNGGKFILPTNTTDEGVDLAINEPYPSATLNETYVTRPVNKRNGLSIEISSFDYVYDLTGKIQETAVAAGQRVRLNRERNIARMVLGITNTYQRDGVSANTYQTARGTTVAYNNTVPMNYLNCLASEDTMASLTADDLFSYKVLMGRNTDPATGYPIDAGPTPKMWVSPWLEARANQAVRSVQVFQGDGANLGASARFFQGEIAVKVQADVQTSNFWYNELIKAAADGGAGLTDDATHARSVIVLGDGKKAFTYLEVWPFNVAAAPLSAEEAKRDITSIYVASEVGVCCVKEPRWVFRVYNTWS